MYESQYADRQASAEQQQQLLIQGRFSSPPTSAAHVADRFEAGGAKIEETLVRLNCRYTTLFFVAGWVVIFSSIAAALGALASLSIPGLIQSLFLLVFGFIVMILDVPGAPAWAGGYRKFVRTHFLFITRLTGKSVWLLYLGSMIAVALWPQRSSRSSGFWMFFALFMSLFVVTVATVGFFIGLRKSLRLEKVRKLIRNAYKGNAPEVFRKYAITDPPHGMKAEEFNRMCADFSQGRCQFDTSDLALIFNCLDTHCKSGINEREFCEWIAGSLSYL